VAVVVEHGGGGGAVAAPIAGKILRGYFDLKKPPVPRKPEGTPQEEVLSPSPDETTEPPKKTAPETGDDE
jgi:penicillin-binding protein 2